MTSDGIIVVAATSGRKDGAMTWTMRDRGTRYMQDERISIGSVPIVECPRGHSLARYAGTPWCLTCDQHTPRIIPVYLSKDKSPRMEWRERVHVYAGSPILPWDYNAREQDAADRRDSKDATDKASGYTVSCRSCRALAMKRARLVERYIPGEQARWERMPSYACDRHRRRADIPYGDLSPAHRISDVPGRLARSRDVYVRPLPSATRSGNQERYARGRDIDGARTRVLDAPWTVYDAGTGTRVAGPFATRRKAIRWTRNHAGGRNLVPRQNSPSPDIRGIANGILRPKVSRKQSWLSKSHGEGKPVRDIVRVMYEGGRPSGGPPET